MVCTHIGSGSDSDALESSSQESSASRKSLEDILSEYASPQEKKPEKKKDLKKQNKYTFQKPAKDISTASSSTASQDNNYEIENILSDGVSDSDGDSDEYNADNGAGTDDGEGKGADTEVLDIEEAEIIYRHSECSEEGQPPEEEKVSAAGRELRKTDVAAMIFLTVFILGILYSAYSAFLSEDNILMYLRTKQEYSSLRGYVLATSGKPVGNVSISLYSGPTLAADTRTDDNGWFLFQGVKSGDYLLRASLSGYKITEKEITVDTTMPRVYELTMEEGLGILKEPSEKAYLEKREDISQEVMVILFLFFSLCALFTAFLCFTRQSFLVALAFSIMSSFSFGFFAGFLLSLGGSILILNSRQMFAGTHRISLRKLFQVWN
ncbi:MAG: carboxypeptidase-like regulatory domain-containing protein [Thermoplasmata archaeon]